jgi:autotransporter-associated beta strand protein
MAYGSLANSGTFSSVVGLPATGFDLLYKANQLDVVPYSNGPATWQNAAGGSWNVGSNWSSYSAPGGVGQQAIVGAATSSPLTITLDGSQTLGTLTFTSSGNSGGGYTLTAGSAGSLTLDDTSGTAHIVVNTGTHGIAAPVMIVGGNLEVSASNGGYLTISGNIPDDSLTGGSPRSLTLDGDGLGALVLSGTNSYQGGTIVSSGTLVVMNNAALADGSSLTVGDASAFGSVIPADSHAIVLGSGINEAASLSISPVPEPGTLVLVMASVVVGLVACRRRGNRGN